MKRKSGDVLSDSSHISCASATQKCSILALRRWHFTKTNVTFLK